MSFLNFKSSTIFNSKILKYASHSTINLIGARYLSQKNLDLSNPTANFNLQTESPEPLKETSNKDAYYEDIVNYSIKPDKLLIDVREFDEIKRTDKIPNSINIPVCLLHYILNKVPPEQFTKRYSRHYPSKNADIIFYSFHGERSETAMNEARKIGYLNARSYNGGWQEWVQLLNNEKKKRSD